MTVDRRLHQGEVPVGHTHDLRCGEIGPVGEGGEPRQVRQQDRDFPLLAFERVGETAARQSHQPFRRQIAADGAVEPPEECPVAHRSKPEDRSECEDRGQDRVSHRQPKIGQHERARTEQAADQCGAHQAERNRPRQLHQDHRARRDIAFAQRQRAVIPERHEREQKSEPGAGAEAQPGRCEQYRPIACRRLDRRDLQQRPRHVVAVPTLDQARSRCTAIARRRAHGSAEKSRRSAVLVFAEHRCADDDDPTFDRLSDLIDAYRRREAGKQGPQAVGRRIRERRRGCEQKALHRGRLPDAPSGAERGKAQGDPPVEQTHNRSRASHPPVRTRPADREPQPAPPPSPRGTAAPAQRWENARARSAPGRLRGCQSDSGRNRAT